MIFTISFLLLFIDSGDSMIIWPGKCCQNSVNQMASHGESRKSLKNEAIAQNSRENCNALPESCKSGKPGSSDLYDEYLWFGHRGNGGTVLLYSLSVVFAIE